MRVRFKPVLDKLASLLGYIGGHLLHQLWIAGNRWPRLAGWAWPMVRQPEWQKSAGLSVVFLPISVLSLRFATNHYGNGLEVIAIQTTAFDVATFGFNKKIAFKDRGASTGASGGKSAVISVVCFLYHKVLAFLLLTTIGWSPLETRMLLAGVGVAENPILFKIRDKWAFTAYGRNDVSTAHGRWESARAVATGHIFWLRTRL